MRSRRHLQVFLGSTRLDGFALVHFDIDLLVYVLRSQSLLQLYFLGSYYVACATPKVAFGLMDCLLYFVD